MKISKYFPILIALFITSIASGQESFHRTYALMQGDSIQSMDATLSGGGATYNVAALIDTGSTEALVVSHFDAKGNVKWSKKLYTKDSTDFAGFAAIEYGDNDSLYIAATTDTDTDNKVMFVLSNDGNVGAVKYYTNGLATSFRSGNHLTSSPTGTMYHGGFGGTGSLPFATIATIMGQGDIGLNRSFNKVNGDGDAIPTSLLALEHQEDSTLLVAGHTVANDNASIAAYLRNVDTLGNGLWAQQYTYPFTESRLNLYDASKVTDSTYVAVGNAVFVNQGFPNFNGIITYVDSIGKEIWSKELVLSNSIVFSNIQEVIIKDGLITIDVELLDLVANVPVSVLITMDQSGTVQEARVPRYFSAVNLGFSPNSLFESGDGSYTFVSSSIEQGGDFTNSFAKLTPNFATPCDTTWNIEFFQDIKLLNEDIAFIESNAFYTAVDSVSAEGAFFYDVPTLDLQDTTYCPNEEFERELDATQEEATAYMWSTGETTPSITVSEEGMYMVTVTMGEDVCYKLCDTVSINRSMLPSIEITPTDGNYCETGKLDLTAFYTPGSSNPVFSWSTGESLQVIQGDAGVSYSVTVTDDCGDTATDSGSFEYMGAGPSVRIDTMQDGPCANAITLTAVSSDNLTYVWNNGSTAESIEVSDAGTYSVVGTNNCAIPETASAEIEIPSVSRELRWARVFFPNGMEDENKSFRPIVNCPELITDYEFKVFNRWGNEVFSTNDPLAGWNGELNDKDQPIEAYIWWAKYRNNGEDRLDKGEVTLLINN